MKKKENNKKEAMLEKDIQELDKKCNKSENEINQLKEKTEQLKRLRETKIQGVLIRSKARYATYGERISKYYCNMEKRHYVSKQMFKLVSKHGQCLESTEEMLEETKDYYKQLYSERPVQTFDADNYVKTLPRLNDDEADQLEGIITIEEASAALKSMPNGKSPGTDGMTVDFFKFFWKQMGVFVVRSLNEGFTKGEMSITQKEGLIICLPKGDKPREYLKNWRPISLLNVTYKIGSSCIANRIKQVLPTLINEDQTGFIAGRYIGDNLRCLYDIIDYLNKNNKPGLLTALDFEKAFDSINWSYMRNVLHAVGFKDDIIQWISAFYNNIRSYITVNGSRSSGFDIKRGCRQGDPISPYLFVICAEVLACKIREETEINGIKIADTEYKISQFADDTSMLLNGDKASYEKLFELLNEFQQISGLKINYEKTANVWLGSMKNAKDKFLEHYDMEWNPPKFKILGLWFCNDLEKMAELNFTNKINEIKQLMNVWLQRTSTPLGRVAVLKSLILSKLTYLWMLLPNPPDDTLKKIQSMCFEFVWDKKRDKIKRKVATQHISKGGLGIPDIKAFVQSLKISWVKKLYQENPPKWTKILLASCPAVESINVFGPQYVTSNILNKFWKNAFEAYNEFYDKVDIDSSEKILIEPIFLNNKFKIENKPIFFKKWINEEILFVKDLVDNRGCFLPIDKFQEKYNFSVQYLEYYGCVSSIKKYIRNQNITITSSHHTDNPKAFETMLNSPKGTKVFYNELIKTNATSTALKNWNSHFQTQIDWEMVFKKVTKIQEIQLRWFQMKIVFRILVTNSMLKDMGILDDNLCSFCREQRDSVVHYMVECEHTKIFWRDLEHFLKEKCGNCERLSINKMLVLFGCAENTRTDEGFDSILLYAKYYIYKSRINHVRPNLQSYLSELKYRHDVEECMYKLQMQYNKFLTKWLVYSNIFT